MITNLIKLANLKSNAERYMLSKYGAELSTVSGHPNFEGGWLDYNPMWYGVATGYFIALSNPLGCYSRKYMVNLNKTSGKFTVYQHIDTVKGEEL